jgi:outer membrane protein
MKKLQTLAALAVLTLSSTAMADFASVSVGAGTWQETPSGGFYKTGDPLEVSVENQLFWQEENQNYLFAKIEHPVPLIPNIRVMRTTLDQNGSGSATFTLNGVSISGTVNNVTSFEQTDVTAYWEILDNVVSLDLGLNAKLIDLSYTVTDGSNTSSDSVKTTIPMVYALVGFSPMPGLLINAEGSAINYSGSTFSDYVLKVSYTTDYLLGVEAGYRNQTYKLDDIDGYFGELKFKGPFAGVYLKF